MDTTEVRFGFVTVKTEWRNGWNFRADNPVIALPSLPEQFQLKYKLRIGRENGQDDITDININSSVFLGSRGGSGRYFCLLQDVFHPFIVIRWRRLKHRQVLLEQLVASAYELEIQNHGLEVMAHHAEEVAEEKIRFLRILPMSSITPVTLIHGPIQQALALTSIKR